MSRPESGFTLVELVITIVILAVLAAAALPSYRDYMRRNAVAAQANSVLVDLQAARSEAITRRGLVSLCARAPGANEADVGCQMGGTNYDGGWLTYVTRTSGNAYSATDATMTLIRQTSASPNTVSLREDGPTTLVFNPRGGLVDGANHYLSVCFKPTSAQAGAGTNTAAVPGKRVLVAASGRTAVVDMAATDTCT